MPWAELPFGRVAFATALCLLALGGPAQAGMKAIWGPAVMPDGSSAFPVYKDLGVDLIEEQLSWRDVAISRPVSPRDPADPAYRWPAALDAMVEGATASGIRVALLVKRTPSWAGGRNGARVPTRAADYADFLVATSRRYPQVRHWMIWGEPTRVGSFSPMPRNRRAGPRAYAVLLDAAYGALKRERRSNVVIGGMTWTLGKVTPPEFLRWMRLPNSRRPRLDWYGHNPFSARIPKLSQDTYYPGLRDFSDIDTLAAEVRRAYPKRRPKLWLSEFTVQSEHPSYAFSFYVTPKAQAEWLRAAYRIAARTPYVAGVGWWTLLDGPEAPDGLKNGLMTAAGVPKPAYAAYKAAVRTASSTSTQRSTIASRPNSRTTASRPAAPIAAAAGGSASSCEQASASASGSSGPTTSPAPVRSISAADSPRAASTTGRPAAMTSSSFVGSALANSRRSRSRTTPASASAYSCGTSGAGTMPSTRTCSRSCAAARTAAVSAPPPAIVTLIRSGPASLAALTSVSSPCASPIVPA